VRAVLKADTSPLSFDGALTYLRQREGSGRAVAKRIGVPESTIRGWGKGATPRAATRQRVIETVREARTRPSLLGDPGVLIPVVSQDRKRGSRERDVSGAQLGLRAGTLAEVRRIWVKTGNADAAAAAFVAGIGDPWYKAQIGRAHLWSDKHLLGVGYWISDQLGEALFASGYTGLRLGKVETV